MGIQTVKVCIALKPVQLCRDLTRQVVDTELKKKIFFFFVFVFLWRRSGIFETFHGFSNSFATLFLEDKKKKSYCCEIPF